jgi:hypothetical protein
MDSLFFAQLGENAGDAAPQTHPQGVGLTPDDCGNLSPRQALHRQIEEPPPVFAKPVPDGLEKVSFFESLGGT